MKQVILETEMPMFIPMREQRQQAYKSLSLIFVLAQAVLILLSSLNQRPWSSWGRGGAMIDAYGTLTGTAGTYFFFAPAVHPQWFVQVHAAGPPVYDEVVGSSALTEEGTLKMVLIEDSFVGASNIPLLLEYVSRHFFERHPDYKTVTITFGYHSVPSVTAWNNGRRTSMTQSIDMTFQRFN